MSKPLTIEELKALQVGDWVWVKADKSISLEQPRYEGYIRIVDNTDIAIHTSMFYFKYADYGTRWIAHKNKEQAESKGEWVELPRIEPFATCNIETGEPSVCYNVLYKDWNSGELVIDCEVDKSEAESLLAELKGD